MTTMEHEQTAVRWRGRPGWRGQSLASCARFDFTALPWASRRHAGEGKTDGILCVKRSHSRQVLRVADARRFGAELTGPVYVKRYLLNSLRRRLGNLVTGGKARREFGLARRLGALGFQTPLPLAWAIVSARRLLIPGAGDGPDSAASFLLTLELPNDGTLAEWVRTGRQGPLEPFLRQLARLLAAMHGRGFFHPDCLSKNFCLAPGASFADPAADPLALFQVHDIDGGRLGALSTRGRAFNLYQMLASLRGDGLPAGDACRGLLREYLAAAGLEPARHEPSYRQRIERLARRRGVDLF